LSYFDFSLLFSYVIPMPKTSGSVAGFLESLRQYDKRKPFFFQIRPILIPIFSLPGRPPSFLSIAAKVCVPPLLDYFLLLFSARAVPSSSLTREGKKSWSGTVFNPVRSFLFL